MQELLKIDKNFRPCPADDGDEFFPNGIFIFNISKMSEYIQNNPDLFTPEVVTVKDIYSTSPHINETHLDSVDISKPVILAEIAPDRFNLLDGHHRAEKAVRQGITTIKAYKLKASQHIQFLKSREAYEKYVAYWNDNVKELTGTLSKDILYQIRITLMGLNPFIWRMALVNPDMPLSYFHKLIQMVMGWQDVHLHHFYKGDTFYAPVREDDGWDGNIKNMDYKGLSIKDILKRKNAFVTYEYDFGDSWRHEIRVENIVPAGKKEHPICMDGRMKCPPEDSGGIWGYMDLLEELNRLDGTERKLFLEDSCMDDFNPEHFDKDEINQQLKKWEAVWLNKWK
jgi:hypothetical protein